MGLSLTVSEICGDFSQNRKIFTPLVFLPSLKGFPLELSIGAGVKKNYNDWATGPTKKFDDIFSHLDRMHERDRQTYTKTAITHSVAR